MHRSIVSITGLLLALAVSCYGQSGYNQKLDLFFVLDGSNSITYNGYNSMISALGATVSSLDVGETSTRVGLVRYTDVLDLKLVALTGDLNQFRTGLDGMKTWPSGTTETHQGLLFAVINLERDSRPDASKVIVIITDGDSNEPLKTLQAANVAKDNNITLLSVATGPYQSRDGLEALASNTLTDVYNFADFPNVIQRVRSLANIDYIECSKALDLVFLIDGSSDVGSQNFQILKDAVRSAALFFNIGQTTAHVGAHSYSNVVTGGFAITDNRNDVDTGIQQLTYSGGSRAVTQALGTAFSEYFMVGASQAGAVRENVPHVAILVTTGPSDFWFQAAFWASELQRVGAHVFALGVTDAVTDGELLNLTNHAPQQQFRANDYSLVQSQLANLAGTICAKDFSSAVPARTIAGSCSSTLDVLFVVDSSTDVGESNFNTVKAAVKNTASYFLDTANEQSRVGVITYSDIVTNQVIVGLRNRTATADYAFGDILALPYITGARNTAGALGLANLLANAPSQRRAGVNLAVVVLLSGPSADTSASKSQAQLLVSDGEATVFVLEMTDAVDTSETSSMTLGIPSRRMRADTYADVDNQLLQLADTICRTGP